MHHNLFYSKYWFRETLFHSLRFTVYLKFNFLNSLIISYHLQISAILKKFLSYVNSYVFVIGIARGFRFAHDMIIFRSFSFHKRLIYPTIVAIENKKKKNNNNIFRSTTNTTVTWANTIIDYMKMFSYHY